MWKHQLSNSRKTIISTNTQFSIFEVIPIYAMKAHRKSKSIAQPILKLPMYCL